MKENHKHIILSDLPKHNVYEVPDDYFDRLPMRIMERTAAAPKSGWVSVQLWQNLRMAIAPLVLLLLFVGVFFFGLESQPEQAAFNIAAVSDAEIVDYLTAYSTVESNDLAELNTLQKQELASEFINVSAADAEAELEYYHLKDTEY
ncbi:hypothetical protein H7F15_09070 [Pontibacter sp. Tf4]|uniref:hypothetical protein n=1 Tax=Pontibacter sp. Tf4 TaxID=2761620 RepID=UPI00162337EF|nr:hypothetical protein [Pontibacter sp. Tf4]MBB6611186.1 hypothetical protein [Pontibacter sp. Tf4]